MSGDMWLEACFIRALVRAGRCSKHVHDTQGVASIAPQRRLQRSRCYRPSGTGQQRRPYSSAAWWQWDRDEAERMQHRSRDVRGKEELFHEKTANTKEPASLEEYYQMMDKCFLSPPKQNDASGSSHITDGGSAEQRSGTTSTDGTEEWPKRTNILSTRTRHRSRPRSTERATAEQEPAYIEALAQRGESLAAEHATQSAVKEAVLDSTRSDFIKSNVARFTGLVHRDHGKVSHEDIFEAYQQIPEPRLRHISESSRRQLLGHFSVVQKRSEASRIRFLAVLEDHVQADIKLGVREWTTAIHLTGKANRKISSENVSSALKLWREMENEAGILANMVTFNSLFDMSIKAGKFALANMILEEVEHRKLEPDHFSHTMKIYYHGIRRSATGIRTAYDALVKAGENVDTAVISAVISSYLKCYEPSAAENVFNHTKKLHAEQYGGPRPLLPHNWRERRKQGKMFTAIKRAKSKEAVNSPIAPGWHAYRELIYYHAVTAGNVDRALDLVDEMVFLYKIPIGAQVFMNLFKGFAMHGGERYSQWTSRYLEAVFDLFLKRLNESSADLAAGKTPTAVEKPSAKDGEEIPQQHLVERYLEDRLVVGDSLLLLCVSAFLKCSSLARAEQVCAILCSHAEPGEGLRERIERLFDAGEADEDRRIDAHNDARLALQDMEEIAGR